MEKHLRSRRDGGRKLLIPYVTAGMRGDWIHVVRALADGGADAIEVGIPFSDPMIDGPTIQAASLQALRRGTTPTQVLSELSTVDVDVPLCVMSYYNIVFRAGHRRFARSLAQAGVSGAIVVDLSLEEARDWCAEADDAGVATVLLVAPSTPDDRAARICERSRGFVYGVGRMGVTGERATLAGSAVEMARRLRGITDLPVCIGIGISSAEQAVEVAAESDGVVVGSALVRRLLEGADAEEAARFIGGIRDRLDAAFPG
ncbi:MAG TPA: tryptophan synthase subunit alpha [Acidimicrobiaceae bacterium]|nr:tryptophan synthase subunit alpha [Acidimicrobiaceae bacterium]